MIRHNTHTHTHTHTHTGAMVTARAVFQLQSKRMYTSHAFEVDTISKTEGTAIHLELKPPSDVVIGE